MTDGSKHLSEMLWSVNLFYLGSKLIFVKLS